LSNAAATLVGQNLGAGHPDRARNAVWRTGLWNMVFLGSVGIVFIVFAPFIIGLFTQDPAVLPAAINCLRIFSCGNVAYAYGMVLLQAFNGAGDTLTPTYVNLFGFWIVEIPLAWWLAIHTFMRVNGVFVSVVVAQSVIVLISLVLFRQGRWAKQRI
jgi:Na+-driven multidrug efflux pump